MSLFLWTLVVCVSAQSLQEETQHWSGQCSMLGSVLTSFELPQDSPLISLRVQVVLHGRKVPDEYPRPRPTVYLRFDSVPTELQHYTKSTVLANWHYYLSRPPKAKELFVRLSGGLESALQLQCAYSLPKWSVQVNLFYKYCEGGSETDGASQCNQTVWTAVNGKAVEVVGSKGRMIVPLFLREITIGVEGLSAAVIAISPRNYAEIDSTGAFVKDKDMIVMNTFYNRTAHVQYPQAGEWFIHIIERNASESLYFLANFQSMKSMTGFRHLSAGSSNFLPKSYADIPLQSFSALSAAGPTSVSYVFRVSPQSQFLRFTLKLELQRFTTAEMNRTHIDIGISQTLSAAAQSLQGRFTGPISLALVQGNASLYSIDATPGVLFHLGYFPPETHFLHISLHSPVNNGTLGVGIAGNPCGVDQCSGDPCELMAGTVPAYECDCRGPRIGVDCGDLAMPGWKYALWVVCLMASNFAMLPAVYLSFFHYSKYGEGCIYVTTMFTSLIYHSCDSQYYCFGLDAAGLRHTDFYLSYLSIVVSIIYLARLQTAELKLGATLLFVVLLLYAMTQSRFNSLLSEVVAPASAGLVPLAKYIWVIASHSRSVEGVCWSWSAAMRFLFSSGNFRWVFGVLAIVSFAAGLTSNVLGTNYGYWAVRTTQTHSIWHVFIMLTPAFVLSVFPPDRADQPFLIVQKDDIPLAKRLLDYS